VTIEKIDIKKHIDELTQLIRESFLTIAEEYGLTKKNTPNNPAFITSGDILKSISEKGVSYFGFFRGGKLIGCYALENAGQGIYYLERLAVKPEERHKGIGKMLVLDSFKKVKDISGKKVSIGMIDANKKLKRWYINLGFTETGKKDLPHLPFRVCFMDYLIN
jgi:diamine N-acetyltransferase